MRAYIIRRLLLIIPTLFILSILVFLSVRFIPGDVIDAMMACAVERRCHSAGANPARQTVAPAGSSRSGARR